MMPGDLLRAVREHRRLSQRELAYVVGVAKSTIDRIERQNSARCSFELVSRILHATGYHLCVYTNQGYPLDVADGRFLPVDRGGRLYPAHLRLRRVGVMHDWNHSEGWWWGWHRKAFWDADPRKPTYTFDRRQPGDSAREVNWVWSDAT